MSASRVGTASVPRARSSSKLVGKDGTKTVSLSYAYSEKSRVVKSGDRGGRAIVPRRPIQATICRVTRRNHSENLCISVDKT